MSAKTIPKILLGFVATVLVGAVGSAVWERVLSPLLNWLYRGSIDAISSVSLTYKNGIYKSAAMGFHETYSFRTFALIGLLVALVALVLCYRGESGRRFTAGLFASHRGKIEGIALITCLAFTGMVLFSIGRHETVNRTVTYSIRSIDILRPYVDEKEYQTLLSQYYRIRTASAFYTFNQALVERAKLHNIELPEFEPL